MPTLAVVPVACAAGIIALVLLWPRVRSGPGGARLVAEVLVAMLALAALMCALLVLSQRLVL